MVRVQATEERDVLCRSEWVNKHGEKRRQNKRDTYANGVRQGAINVTHEEIAKFDWVQTGKQETPLEQLELKGKINRIHF